MSWRPLQDTCSNQGQRLGGRRPHCVYGFGNIPARAFKVPVVEAGRVDTSQESRQGSQSGGQTLRSTVNCLR